MVRTSHFGRGQIRLEGGVVFIMVFCISHPQAISETIQNVFFDAMIGPGPAPYRVPFILILRPHPGTLYPTTTLSLKRTHRASLGGGVLCVCCIFLRRCAQVGRVMSRPLSRKKNASLHPGCDPTRFSRNRPQRNF